MQDNQLTNKNLGLMGIFAPAFASLNGLYKMARLTVPIKYEDDFTIIPVNIFKDGKKSHEVETGIMTFCEHLETINGNCLKCGEWQDC